MSWNISCVENTLVIPDDAVAEVNATIKEMIYADDDFVFNNRLEFFTDHMEHMDYMWHDELNAVLLRHKVNGFVAFSSLDGDDAGNNWGYHYNDGVMTKVKGKVVWDIPAT